MIVKNFGSTTYTEDKLLSSTLVTLYPEDNLRREKLPKRDNWPNKWNKSLTAVVSFQSLLAPHLGTILGAKWGLQNINSI